MHQIKRTVLLIPENRQRREFDEVEIIKLKDSILAIGLLHPIVVRSVGGLFYLVAGERRLKAMDIALAMGDRFRCGSSFVEDGYIPVTEMGELSDLSRFEAEYEENVRRIDLSWQERVQATAHLAELRNLQAAQAGLPPPTARELKLEISGDPNNAQRDVTNHLIIARHLNVPEVQKARSVDEAMKIIKRTESLEKSAELAVSVGLTFSKASHTLLRGNCLDLMPTLQELYDVILTDPPYGMGAETFSDSGRALGGGGGDHFYDDSYTSWQPLIREFARLCSLVTKPQAHVYCFCDIDRFHELRDIFSGAGFQTFRTPIVWNNPTSMRAPWPTMGPQRKWQLVMFAAKGSKPVIKLHPDCITFPSDLNLNHHAQKPVALFENLLLRSVRPGDSVLDPFCGTGPVFAAAHALTCRATGIELDAASYGIAVERIGKLP